MAKRSTRDASPLFKRVLSQAHAALLNEAEKAANYQHKGLRGNHRAGALGQFLSSHLPNVFKVGAGEARDYKDRVTGELDLFIYDYSTAAPIQDDEEKLIIPAEALYAVIEVKSVLTLEEIDNCFVSARKVRDLEPFKKPFIAPPMRGAVEEDGHRCPYFVFAYTSNLVADDWANKEFSRIADSAKQNNVPEHLLDRVIVLNRGIIRPQIGMALLNEDSSGLFLEFYLHLINFLTRERKRRPPIDWAVYSSTHKWTKLTKL